MGRYTNKIDGFTLPTVLLASVLMLAVLATALQLVSATSASLRDQYYNQLAREAAEAGVLHAQECLGVSNYEATWTDAKPLRPNTDCSGNVVSSRVAYVAKVGDTTSTYTVSLPTRVSGVQRVAANSSVSLTRASDSSVWRTYGYTEASVVGATITFTTVTFGYAYTDGAFFATVGPTGSANALGYNGNGQLGNGTTASAPYPRQFVLPAGEKAVALYSNFLSVGFELFAITASGDAYGAGKNESGQIGNGTISSTVATPVRFQLPSGVRARFVNMLRSNTYVIGSDNNIYTAGRCVNGVLGSNYVIAGCSNQSTPVRVALPAPVASNPNTIPVADPGWVQSTNLVADRANVYIRMEGGAVYGWGVNDYGQLANGTKSESSTPVRVGNFGNSGATKAVQLSFNGDSIYILDSEGDVYAAGLNDVGQLAGAMSPVMSNTDLCLDNTDNAATTGRRIRLWTCYNTNGQKIEWTSDGALKFRPNNTTELCVDNANASSADRNPIRLWTCNNSAAQKWLLRDDGSIYNAAANKCIDNPGNSATAGAQIQLYTCNASAAQQWSLQPALTLSKVPISEKVTRITTDQRSVLFLTESGKVWGGGTGLRGQLGNGELKRINAAPVAYSIPAGRKAIDFYTTRAASSDVATIWANSYVILDDRSIIGSGTNSYGQLGNGGTSTVVASPVKMNLPSGVRAASVQSGLGTTVVLTTDGKIYTVGNNEHGQLGDSTTTNSSTPRPNRYTNVMPATRY